MEVSSDRLTEGAGWTLGGAEALYLDEMIGNFAPGKEADLVVLDWKGGPSAQSWRRVSRS